MTGDSFRVFVRQRTVGPEQEADKCLPAAAFLRRRAKLERRIRMKKSGSVFTAKRFMAGVLAACLAGCGGGDDGKILGTGAGSGGSGPGPAGTEPALGAAGAVGGFGGNAGITNRGTRNPGLWGP